MAANVTFDKFTKSFFQQPDGMFVFYKDEGGKKSGFTLKSKRPITNVALSPRWKSHLSPIKTWSDKNDYFWKGRIEVCSSRNNRKPFVVTVNNSARLDLFVMSKRKIYIKKKDMDCEVESKEKAAKVLATLCYRRLGSIRGEIKEMRNELSGLKQSVSAMGELKKSVDAMKKDISTLHRLVRKEMQSIRDAVGTEMIALHTLTGNVRKLAAIACVDPPEKRAKVSGEEDDISITWEF